MFSVVCVCPQAGSLYPCTAPTPITGPQPSQTPPLQAPTPSPLDMSKLGPDCTGPPPDMFKHLHYEVQTAGERVVGIQLPSTFILRWYICRYVEEIGLAAMMAAKRLASVTPEVDLRECVTRTPNKDAHSGFETQRRYQKKSKISKIGVSVVPQKGLMSFKNLNQKKMVRLSCVHVTDPKSTRREL